MHAHDTCMHTQSLFLTHAHTSLSLHEVHAVPKQKDPDVVFVLFFVGFFLSPVRGTNLWQRSGYMVWLRPGSSNICTVLINVYFNLLGLPEG